MMLFFKLHYERRVWVLTIFQPTPKNSLSATRVGLYGSRAEVNEAIESIAAHAAAAHRLLRTKAEERESAAQSAAPPAEGEA